MNNADKFMTVVDALHRKCLVSGIPSRQNKTHKGAEQRLMKVKHHHQQGLGLVVVARCNAGKYLYLVSKTWLLN